MLTAPIPRLSIRSVRAYAAPVSLAMVLKKFGNSLTSDRAAELALDEIIGMFK